MLLSIFCRAYAVRKCSTSVAPLWDISTCWTDDTCFETLVWDICHHTARKQDNHKHKKAYDSIHIQSQSGLTQEA